MLRVDSMIIALLTGKSLARLRPAIGSHAFGLALAAPFLMLPGNIMGLVIIAIALYEAWKLSVGASLKWEGPVSYVAPEPTFAPAPEVVAGG